jgi:hypothetical protein
MLGTISCKERFERCVRDENLLVEADAIVFPAGTPTDTLSLAYTELCTAGPTHSGRVCAPSDSRGS